MEPTSQVDVILNNVTDNRSYKIHIYNDLPPPALCDKIISIYKPPRKFYIVTDCNVGNIYQNYAQSLVQAFTENDYFSEMHHLLPREGYKTPGTFAALSFELIRSGISRNSTIIAFGGGTIGDLTGFTASTVLRGVDFIQVPTTLLSAVDSSIGGKTAINAAEPASPDTQYPITIKNAIGTFKQPKMVICNLKFLETLPDSEILCGLAEMLKHSIIHSKELFQKFRSADTCSQLLSKEHRYAILPEFIQESCKIKAKIVQEDELETKEIRTLLNFGHTIGHAIEAMDFSQYGISKSAKPDPNCESYYIKHGEAVAIGMLIELHISKELHLLGDEDFTTMCNLLQQYKLWKYVDPKILIEIQALSPQVITSILTLSSSDKKNTDTNAISPQEIIDTPTGQSSQIHHFRLKKSVNFTLIYTIGKAKMYPVETKKLYEILNKIKFQLT